MSDILTKNVDMYVDKKDKIVLHDKQIDDNKVLSEKNKNRLDAIDISIAGLQSSTAFLNSQLNALKTSSAASSSALKASSDTQAKRLICHDEIVYMLTSGVIETHSRSPYDDEYDTEIIAGTAGKDTNNREYTPVTVKVYKKGDTAFYSRQRNIYKIAIYKGGSSAPTEIGIVLEPTKYKMMDIYPTSGPQTTKYNTMLEPPDKFNTKKLTTMYQMFYDCEKMTKTDVSNFNTSNVTDMSEIFNYCPLLTTIDVSKWDTSKVTNMSYMFRECNSLTTLDVSNFNTSNVTNMSFMFRECNSLTTLDVSKWDTSKVTDMYGMFNGCNKLITLDVSKWNTSNVANIGRYFFSRSYSSSVLYNSIFEDCSSLTTLDVSKWNTSKIKNMNAVFSGCSSLTTLDVSKWDISNVIDM